MKTWLIEWIEDKPGRVCTHTIYADRLMFHKKTALFYFEDELVASVPMNRAIMYTHDHLKKTEAE